MITINNPEVIGNNKSVKIQSLYEIAGNRNYVWFEVDRKFQDYVTFEKADAFLVGLLPVALMKGLDIHVNGTVSKKLYYSLSKYLLPMLAKTWGRKEIRIHCSQLTSEKLGNPKAVGTGLSCGIDSFSTIYDHMRDSCPDEYQLDYLTFFNVGSHGAGGGEKAENLFKKRTDIVKECALELNKELIIINSNLNDVFYIDFPKVHTLRNISAALILQKLFKTYYYSSAVPADQFKVNEKNMGFFDIFTLGLLETENIELYSSCSTLSRVEKTKKVSALKASYKYLNVCMKDGKNCGECAKCLRTLLTLEVVGGLDKYKKIFNMESYYNKRNMYIASVLTHHKTDPFMEEIYNEMKRVKFLIPKISIFLSLLKIIKSITRKTIFVLRKRVV